MHASSEAFSTHDTVRSPGLALTMVAMDWHLAVSPALVVHQRASLAATMAAITQVMVDRIPGIVGVQVQVA